MSLPLVSIIRDSLTNPKFYKEIFKLLGGLIQQQRYETISYEEFLRQAEKLVKNMATKAPIHRIPASLHGKPKAIITFNNLPSIMADSMSSMMKEERSSGGTQSSCR